MTESSPTASDPGTGVLEDRCSPLVAHAAEGDPAALSHLLKSARPVVYRWAATRTGNHDDAEDVTQLVLLRLYSHVSAFRGESRLSSWLYRVTINEVAGYQRRESRHRSVVFMWADRGPSEGVARPRPERIDHQRQASAVREAASSLPPLQRAAFALVDLKGLRPCEAARKLGQTQTAIRSNLCRARKKIRELVRQCTEERAREAGSAA